MFDVKSKLDIFFNFVAFSKNLNFMIVGNSLILHKNLFVKSRRRKSSFFFSNSDIV